MVTVLNPASLWQQLSSAFFLSSGMFNDLLIIRCSLVMANSFLLIAGSLGHLSWTQSFRPKGNIAVDTVIWASLNLLVHGLSVIRLFIDERRIELTDKETPLYCYLYRHSGISKAKFKKYICPSLKLVEFKKGHEIPLEGRFFIVLEGVINANAEHLTVSQRQLDIPIVSGQMFPLQFMIQDYMPRENVFARTYITPVAATDVKLYTFPSAKLKEMSKFTVTRDAWTSLLVATLAVIAERPYYPQADPEDYLDGNPLVERRSRLFDPLEPSEEPDPWLAGSNHVLENPLAHIWEYMKDSVFLPWPVGRWPVALRHKLPPPTDPNAEAIRNRLASYKEESIKNVEPSMRNDDDDDDDEGDDDLDDNRRSISEDHDVELVAPSD